MTVIITVTIKIRPLLTPNVCILKRDLMITVKKKKKKPSCKLIMLLPYLLQSDVNKNKVFWMKA